MDTELLNELFANVDWLDIWLASQDTLIMVGVSLVFTIAFGLPLGVLLFLTSRQQLLGSPRLYRVLAFMTNLLRSLPFVILLIAMIPITVLLTGTSIGVAGVIPPLVIGATPFFARLVETALREVDRGIIEASQAMGASTRQIVLKALLPEALPSILASVIVTAITLVSYSAMSGLVGGGGLGDLAVRNGYQRFQTDVMIVTVVLLLILVQVLQSVGDRLVQHFSRKLHRDTPGIPSIKRERRFHHETVARPAGHRGRIQRPRRRQADRGRHRRPARRNPRIRQTGLGQGRCRAGRESLYRLRAAERAGGRKAS